MNRKTLGFTIVNQTICIAIILLGLSSSPKNILAEMLPDRFLGPIYYGEQGVSKVFDHEYPLWVGLDGNTTTMHYDGTPYNDDGSLYGYDQHTGIDYGMYYKPVLAAASGTVTRAGWAEPDDHRSSYGLHVRISHENEYTTVYGHFSALVVQVDNTVTVDPADPGNRQAIIGISGNTGVVRGGGDCLPVNEDPQCGAHLHFELRTNQNIPVNPYGWIGLTPDPWPGFPPPTYPPPSPTTGAGTATPTPFTPQPSSGATSYDLWLEGQYPAHSAAYPQFPGGTPANTPAPLEAYVTVDNEDNAYTQTPTQCMQESNTGGYNGTFHYIQVVADDEGEPTCTARWTIQPVSGDISGDDGDYEVYVYIPESSTIQFTRSATYAINHGGTGGPYLAVVVQGAYNHPDTDSVGNWVYIGRYYFTLDGTEYIEISNKTIDGDDASLFVAADAIKLSPLDFAITPTPVATNTPTPPPTNTPTPTPTNTSTPMPLSNQWPTYLHDNAHTGYNPVENTLMPPLVLIHRFDPPAGYLGPTVAPVVDENYVFVVFDNGEQSKIYAFNRLTNVMVWEQNVFGESSFASNPTVKNGIFYLGSSDSDILYALSASTGNILWQKTFLGDWSSPVVDNNFVYIVVELNDTHTLYALDTQTGSTQWTYSIPESCCAGSPIIVNNNLVFQAGDQVVAVNKLTGQGLWTQQFTNQTFWDDIVGDEVNNLIYVYGLDVLGAINVNSGIVVWTIPYGHSTETNLVLANNKLYHIQWLGTQQYLHRFNPLTGAIESQVVIPSNDYYLYISMANGIIYAALDQNSSSPLVRAFDAITGSILWESMEIGGGILASPAVIARERLYVKDTANGGLVVYEVIQPQTPTPTPTYTPTSSPTPSNTGFKSPLANSADSGGDGNGFEINPTNAYSDNALFAVDNNSGTGVGIGTACTNTGNDKHRFYNYSFFFPNNVAIQGIEVRLDAKTDSIVGSPKMCVQLSWDGGVTWTTGKLTPIMTSIETTYLLGGVNDTWGHQWRTSEFTNTNFRVRIVNIVGATDRDFSLDWVAVKVYYQ